MPEYFQPFFHNSGCCRFIILSQKPELKLFCLFWVSKGRNFCKSSKETDWRLKVHKSGTVGKWNKVENFFIMKSVSYLLIKSSLLKAKKLFMVVMTRARIYCALSTLSLLIPCGFVFIAVLLRPFKYEKSFEIHLTKLGEMKNKRTFEIPGVLRRRKKGNVGMKIEIPEGKRDFSAWNWVKTLYFSLNPTWWWPFAVTLTRIFLQILSKLSFPQIRWSVSLSTFRR